MVANTKSSPKTRPPEASIIEGGHRVQEDRPRKADYTPKAEYTTFAAALRRHRQGSGFPTQARLAAMLDCSWHAVGAWERAIWAPSPEKVFEIERLLALTPGTLSSHLGYLPVTGAQPSVLAAIDADPKLTSESKELLVGMYKSLVRKRAIRPVTRPEGH